MAPPFSEMIFLDELRINENEPETEANIIIDNGLAELTNEEMVAEVMEKVENSDGYRYARSRLNNPKKRFIINFAFLCCQRTEVQHQHTDNERRRVRHRLETFECEGKVVGNIDRHQQRINIRISHPHHHDRPPPRANHLVSEEVKEFIQQNALQMTSPQLYHEVCRIFGLETTRAQVYHWREKVLHPLYHFNDDQMLSSRELIRRRPGQGFDEVSWKRLVEMMGVVGWFGWGVL
jgi:hypothetical protein